MVQVQELEYFLGLKKAKEDYEVSEKFWMDIKHFFLNFIICFVVYLD